MEKRTITTFYFSTGCDIIKMTREETKETIIKGFGGRFHISDDSGILYLVRGEEIDGHVVIKDGDDMKTIVAIL